MSWKGTRYAKVLMTEADVLEHSYGRRPEPEPEPEAAEPEEETEPEAAEPEEELEPEEGEDESPDGVDSIVAKLDEMKKDELKALAESLGLDSSGNKSDIALRIAEHQLSS